jgi:hypothetical protein
MVSSDGMPKCLEPMHTLFEHILLHVQMSIISMEVDKHPKTYPKISKKLKHGFYLCDPHIMSPNHLLYINKGRCKSFNGLSHHLVKKNTNAKKSKTKLHSKLQCWMGRWPYKLKKYERHTHIDTKNLWNMIVWTWVW